MNIIHIDEKSYSQLMTWKAENHELIKAVSPYSRYYFEKVQVDFGIYPNKNNGKLLVAYFEKKHDYLEFRVKYDKVQIAKGKIEATPEGVNDYGIHCQLSDSIESSDEIQHIIRMIVESYISVNALILYGNLVDGSSTTVRARSEDNDKHYFVKEFQNKLYAVTSHTHRSPEGIFSVRGHFRKYKSGKVIWIDEFLKGNKEK